jgi:hypothetical protein
VLLLILGGGRGSRRRPETAQELRGLVEAKLQGQPAAAVEPENRVLPL